MKKIIFFLILSYCTISFSQDKQQIILGNWRTCYVIGSKSNIDKCDSIQTYNLTYTFANNNRYTHTQIVKNETFVENGKWELSKGKLTTDSDDTSTATSTHTTDPYTVKIKWIDSDTFYTVGREGFLGPKVYHYYFRYY